MPENLDAIVIGSGISGLTTASLLAKAGKKVLVLEQHDQAGGCCHTFVEKGFEFDSGKWCRWATISHMNLCWESNSNASVFNI